MKTAVDCLKTLAQYIATKQSAKSWALFVTGKCVAAEALPEEEVPPLARIVRISRGRTKKQQ